MIVSKVTVTAGHFVDGTPAGLQVTFHIVTEGHHQEMVRSFFDGECALETVRRLRNIADWIDSAVGERPGP